MPTQTLLSMNLVRRKPESVETDMVTGRVYVLRDPDGKYRYVGKNHLVFVTILLHTLYSSIILCFSFP